LYRRLAIPAATAALWVSIRCISDYCQRLARRCQPPFELARARLGCASENVVGALMYEFVADQALGISGLINLSNIVFLVAFSVRDVLKLRILAVVGEGLTLPYYYFQGEKLWPPIFRRS
jgi:hypothetical protein